MAILLIDNYDSFTYNIYQYLEELGNHVIVYRNDKLSVEDVRGLKPEAIFLSPGPGTPRDAGICIQVIQKFAGHIPIFGICLGHQAIGEAFGATVTHAKGLMHGKTSKIKTLGRGVMRDMAGELVATRYHSLAISKDSLPDCLEITCETQDGEIMGVVHKNYEVEGVQFHPESILTDTGKTMLRLFMDRTVGRKQVPKLRVRESLTMPTKARQNITSLSCGLEINQYVTEYSVEADPFGLFERVRDLVGETNCFLMDSAVGPKVDCTRSLIGLFPQFELVLDRSMLNILSAEPDWRIHLEETFDSIYPHTNKGYDIGRDKFSKIFEALAERIRVNRKHQIDLPLNNGLAGYFGYEYLHYLEEIPRKEDNVMGLPEVHLKYFPVLMHIEYGTKRLQLVENRLHDRPFTGITEIQRMLGLIQSGYNGNDVLLDDKAVVSTESNIQKERFIEIVRQAKRYIFEGDIFQVQLGQRIVAEAEVDALEVYNILRKLNPSPYMFFWDTGDYQLIGNSPELQLKVNNGEMMIRPIAGTSKGKGFDSESRLRIINAFREDIKENAEHVMLVDLARNDIGRMAIPGTVKVTDLMDVEEFSHVFHLTSTVKGKLMDVMDGFNSMEVFEATFPAGTLTGAPKVRAMEIISELESEVRGPYGGAFGFFDFNGNLVSSIIIRTIVKKGNRLFLQASAGIVADSDPEQEWNETLYKMGALRQAISKAVAAKKKERHTIA